MNNEIIEQLERRLEELMEQEPYATDTISAYQLVIYDLKGGEL